MNSIEELINRLYEENLPVVLDGIQDEYKEEVKVNYKKDLEDRFLEDYKDFKELDKLYEILSRAEGNSWKNSDVNYKLYLLINDDALNKLSDLSSYGATKAIERQNNDTLISEEDANKDIKEMEKLLDEVKPFNKELAEELFSDGKLDYLNASNQTEYHSLRTSHR